MTQLLIEIDSLEDVELLLALLPKLNARLLERREIPKRSFQEIAEELSKTDIAERFGDPSEWQRETRKDRPLPGREY